MTKLQVTLHGPPCCQPAPRLDHGSRACRCADFHALGASRATWTTLMWGSCARNLGPLTAGPAGMGCDHGLAEEITDDAFLGARRRLPTSSTPRLERPWDAWQAERYQRGEISQRPATPTTRSGCADDHPVLQRTPGLFRKLDAIAVLTGPLLPAPRVHWRGSVRHRCSGGIFAAVGGCNRQQRRGPGYREDRRREWWACRAGPGERNILGEARPRALDGVALRVNSVPSVCRYSRLWSRCCQRDR